MVGCVRVSTLRLISSRSNHACALCYIALYPSSFRLATTVMDRDAYVDLLRSRRSWTEESFASVSSRPSVAISSTSQSTCDPFDLIDCNFDFLAFPPSESYPLDDLISTTLRHYESAHRESCHIIS